MNIQFRNGTLTVKTGITPEVAEKATGRMVAKDEKDNELYAFFITPCSDGSIGTRHIEVNAVVDGEFAFVRQYGMGVTLDDIKKELADNLLNAQKHLPVIKEAVETKAAAVDALFAPLAE